MIALEIVAGLTESIAEPGMSLAMNRVFAIEIRDVAGLAGQLERARAAATQLAEELG